MKADVINCRFEGQADGESVLKECQKLTVEGCYFDLRYPFWHVNHAVIRNSEMTANCRNVPYMVSRMQLCGMTRTSPSKTPP